MSMKIILPDGSGTEVSNAVAHYINCLKNFHMAVECEVERHNSEKQDIFTMSVRINRHLKNYNQDLTDLLYQGCREVAGE